MPKIRNARLNNKKYKQKLARENRKTIIEKIRQAKTQAQLKTVLISLAEIVSDLIESMED